MKKNRYLIYALLAFLLLLGWWTTRDGKSNDIFPERVKIALREVGNQLLLQNNDSTSRVLPITRAGDSLYRVTFEKPLTMEPARLVATVDTVLKRAALPSHYITEVKQCTNDEVAYSYQVNLQREETLIPCSGRNLPEGCYSIELRFTKGGEVPVDRRWWLPGLALLLIVFLFDFLRNKKQQDRHLKESAGTIELGIFKFYPEQNKLVREASEISLSRKECELLEIFVASPNTVIKRDELTKKVWEDNGVIVGRSLDTYISKLRKKLREDDSIKLTNVHGVGYKLEVS
ncbi:MAG: winged helix-turn-helix domain-containing protein [Bacteroidota bacterium]